MNDMQSKQTFSIDQLQLEILAELIIRQMERRLSFTQNRWIDTDEVNGYAIKVAISRYNPGGVEPMISHRIEKIAFHFGCCKNVKPKLKKLLNKYQALLKFIQD